MHLGVRQRYFDFLRESVAVRVHVVPVDRPAS